MTLKQNPLLDLYNEGKQFEQTTKQVEIEIRSKQISFTIRPQNYDDMSRLAVARARISNAMRDNDGLDAEGLHGEIMLDMVIRCTLEFSDLLDDEIQESGAESKVDFVKTALGAYGVTQLYNHIQQFTDSATEKQEDEVFEIGEEIKN